MDLAIHMINSFDEFYKNHSNSLLNRNEILSLSDKLFTTSGFGSSNRKLLLEIDKAEKICFGFKEGILFTDINFYFFTILGPSKIYKFKHIDFQSVEAKNHSLLATGVLKINGNHVTNENRINKFSIDLYKPLKLLIEKSINEFYNFNENEKIKQQERENQRIEKERTDLLILQKHLLGTFDQNGDGKIDLIENDFINLLNKNQKKVSDLDKNYIHQFVKVSTYLKTKKNNIQIIFETIEKTSSKDELKERIDLLSDQIHTYELLVFHSLNLIGSIVKEDFITFYEIYETFDKIGIYNSNWENEVSGNLLKIGDKLDDLLYSINKMENNIVSEISNLSYVTQESFEELGQSVTNQLEEIDSRIKFNNLLTGIQTYQLNKINKNTGSIGN